MIINAYKEELDILNLVGIAKVFIYNEHGD